MLFWSALLNALILTPLGLSLLWATCCQGCLICDDNFDRANNTDVNAGGGCGWTEVAGDWSISSNKMTVSTADAILKLNSPGPDSNLYLNVAINVPGTSTTRQAQVHLDWQDANNSVYFAVGAQGFVKLYQRAAGVDTEIATTSKSPNGGTDCPFFMCIEDNHIKASYSDASPDLDVPYTPSGSGYVALATGPTVTGTILFNNFELRRVVDTATTDCQECKHCTCTGSTWHQQQKVVISGMTSVGEPCSCGNLNGTYYLDWLGSEPITSVEASVLCAWDYVFSGDCTIQRIIYWYNGSRTYVSLVDHAAGHASTKDITFEHNQGTDKCEPNGIVHSPVLSFWILSPLGCFNSIGTGTATVTYQ